MIAAFVAMLAAVVGVMAGLVHPLAPFAVLIIGVLLASAMTGAFALLVAFAAVLFLRPADFFPDLAGSNPAKIAALATLAVFVGSKALRREFGLAMSPANRWMTLLTLAAMASCFFSDNPGASTGFFSNVLLKILVLWLMVVNVVDTRRRAVSLQVATAIFTALLGAYAIYAKMTQSDLVEQTRAVFVGVLGDPNDLALTLLVGIPFTLDAFRRVKGGSRFLFLILGVLAIGGIVATQSRGGVIGLGACMYFWLRGIGWRRVTTVGLVIMGVAAAYIYGGIQERTTTSDDVMEMDSSSQGRVDAWVAGLNMFQHNPIFGVGLNRATEHYVEYAIDPLSWRPKTSHNAYIQVLAETGLAGFIPFALLLAFAVVTNYRLKKVDPGEDAPPLERAYLTAQLPCLVGVMVAAFFLSAGWSWFLYMLLAQSAVSHRQWL